MKQSNIEIYFFFLVFLAVLALCFFIFLPFISTIALAAVFAVLFYPLFERIKRAVAFDSIAAGLVLIIVVLLVVVPISVIGYLLFLEARDVFVSLSAGEGHITDILHGLENYIASYSPGFELNIREYAQTALGFITQSLGSVFARTFEVILAVFLGLIALYYFLKDGEKFKNAIIAYSPLGDVHDRVIIEKLKLTINSVLKGSLLIAILQGVLSGIGLAIFGVPSPVLWGALAGIAALIPNVGTTLILGPAILYLFFTSGAGATLGLLIWGVLAVGLIDNFLGPIFIGRGVHIHPFFVLISVLGGLSLFGPVGFILGPIVLSLLVVLAEIYTFLIAQKAP